MTKEQCQQMFGVDSISDWLDFTSLASTFIREGKAAKAVSLLSDVQEVIAVDTYDTYEDARTAINRIKYLLSLSQVEEIERRIVGQLMRYLESKDFEIVGVQDEEERYSTRNPVQAMGHIFAVDEARLLVRSQVGNVGREHFALLILGNGEDIIADWNYSLDDVDGFNAAMEAFKVPEAV